MWTRPRLGSFVLLASLFVFHRGVRPGAGAARGRADQPVDGGGLDGDGGGRGRQLLEPGDHQRLAPLRDAAQLPVPAPEHPPPVVAAGGLGRRLFPAGRTGTARAGATAASGPCRRRSLAFRLSDDSPWTFSLGTQYLVGGGVNFPGSSANPLVSPHDPPRSFGLGPIYSNLAVGLSSIIASRQVTDRLAIAAGPVDRGRVVEHGPGGLRAAGQPVPHGGLPHVPLGLPRRGRSGGAGSRSACFTR